MYIPPDINFVRNVLDDEDIIGVHFSITGNIKNELYTFDPPNALMYEKLFTDMLNTYNAKGLGYRLKLNEQLYRIVYLLLNDEIRKADNSITIVEKVAQLIEQELSNPYFSTDSVAGEFGLSNTRIRVLFKRRYGMLPKEYQFKCRMEMAETMLKTNYFTVKETANKCGYENEKYFSTAFKKRYGISPTEFRRL